MSVDGGRRQRKSERYVESECSITDEEEAEETFREEEAMHELEERWEESAGIESDDLGPQSVDLMQIHDELTSISKKLHAENDLLHEREARVCRREEEVKELEEAVRRSHKLLEKYAEEEVNRRWTKLRQEYERESAQREEMVKNKAKENKRLRSSFEVIQDANKALKKQVEELEERNQKLETQLVSMQRRLTNLQRKNELASRQRQIEDTKPLQQKHASDQQQSAQIPVSILKQKPLTAASGIYGTLGILLDWLSSSLHLSQKSSTLPATQEKCCKILPHLAELLPNLSAHGTKLQYPCLDFIFWSLITLESGTRKNRITLSSTLRRIGEELYNPTKCTAFADTTAEDGEEEERLQLPACYFHSRSLHIRVLSTFIILKTLTQVDHLAHAFDSLRADLRDDTAKDIFLQHEGVLVMIPYLKMTSRGLLNSAVDVFLQLSMESVFLSQFLKSCSNEEFFRASSVLLKDPKFGAKLQEKLCIILQRLSKLKCNHRYFEAFQFGPLFHDLLHSSNPDQAFLTLNIRSILSNLNLSKS